MAEQIAVPGQNQHQNAGYLDVDPVDLVGQLEQSNLAYGHPQASCLEQAVAGNQIQATWKKIGPMHTQPSERRELMSLQTRTDITCPAWLKSSYSCESVTDASRSPTYSDCAPPPPRPTATPTPPAAAAAVTAPGEPPFWLRDTRGRRRRARGGGETLSTVGEADGGRRCFYQPTTQV
uniref:Uncharacterized protein n=1 Tax=Oryza rufipogon TaxID=4529 RepID=A0A0E0PBA0_ORYRU